MAPAGAFQLRACGGPALTALPMSAILKLSGVSKRFGSLVANDNLSMHLNDGEALRVIGPNRSGQTTMFNILAKPTLWIQQTYFHKVRVGNKRHETNAISHDGGDKLADERYAPSAFDRRDDTQYVSALLEDH